MWDDDLEYAPLKPKKREGKETMAEAIFLASKQRGDEEGEEDNEDDKSKALPLHNDEVIGSYGHVTNDDLDPDL
jgi:hypothetical protein